MGVGGDIDCRQLILELILRDDCSGGRKTGLEVKWGDTHKQMSGLGRS